jgi:hypothetical protein
MQQKVGHPKIFHGTDISKFDINTMDGIVKLKKLPPNSLYIQVLSQKMHNKLLSILCQKCAFEKVQEYCTHTDDERCFIGTFVIDEVRLALSKGYVIKQIYEAWTTGHTTLSKKVQ